MDFPLDYVRGCFPALKDSDTVYFDNSDAPRPLGAVSAFAHDGFDGDPDALLSEIRENLAFFLNSNASWADEEIVLAPNVSDLAAALSHSLAKHFPRGSEIVTTELDDDAGLAPWNELESDVIVRRWPVQRRNAGLDTSRFDEVVSEKSRLVVMAKASSAVGSIVELLPVALGLQNRESSLLIHWSAFLPHGAIDTRFLRSDFVLASTRLFFGAEVAFLWGNRERMRSLRDEGSPVFELPRVDPGTLAGFGAALRYIEEVGLITQEMQLQPSEDYGRRRHMRRAMQAIRHYERDLTALALRRLRAIPGVSVFGVHDPDAAAHRIPHILFRLEGIAPSDVVAALAERNVRVSHGNGGAPHLMRALGLPEDEGGVVLTMLHYNSEPEIERLAEVLHEIASQRHTMSR